jgi:hypothetical protein
MRHPFASRREHFHRNHLSQDRTHVLENFLRQIHIEANGSHGWDRCNGGVTKALEQQDREILPINGFGARASCIPNACRISSLIHNSVSNQRIEVALFQI